MSFDVRWSENSKKYLISLPIKDTQRILTKIESIKEQPFNYVKHLVGVPLFSLRIGNYRIILDIKNKKMLIFVIDIGNRKNTHKNL